MLLFPTYGQVEKGSLVERLSGGWGEGGGWYQGSVTMLPGTLFSNPDSTT